MRAINGSKTLFRYFFLLAFLAVPVSARAQEENEAEKIFRKAEKQLVEAKTLSWRSLSKVIGLRVRMNVFLGEEGKWRMNIFSGGKIFSIISDGKRFHDPIRRGETVDSGVFRDLHPFMMTRYLPPVVEVIKVPFSPEDRKDFLENFKPRNFELLGEEKLEGRKAVKIRYYDTRYFCQFTLWVDKKTNLPVKRSVMFHRELGMPPYEHKDRFFEISINGKLDERQFQIPVNKR